MALVNRTNHRSLTMTNLLNLTVNNFTGFRRSLTTGSSARRLYDAQSGRSQGLNPWSDIDEYSICQHRIV